MANTGFAGLSRMMKGVVIASLAANLLVVGALATAWHRHGGKHHWRGGSVERSLMHFAYKELPRDKRRALKKVWRDKRETLRPLFKEIRGARKEVGQVLQRDVYDRAALTTALNQVWQKRMQVRERASNTFVELVETLTDDEKRAFGKFIEENKHGWWRRGHRRWKHRD